ncbi:ABC transporter permease [Patescibacteria group bacterium]
MYIIDTLKYSWRNLFLQKGRSFLTMLGIIIGVSAVISVMAVGASAEQFVVGQIEAMGSNIVGIMAGGGGDQGPPAAAMGIEITTLTYEDALALEQLPHFIAVSPYVSGQGIASFENKSKDLNYLGVSYSYINVEDTSVSSGRFFRQEEVDSLARVAVLGSEVKKDFFGIDNALGKRIKINQVSFKIVGVMEERGASGFQNNDEQIFIPVRTAQKILLGIDHVAFLRGKVDKEENVNLVISQSENILRHRHNISDPAKDDFSVRSTAQALDMLGSVTLALSLFLAMVAGISLIVGGVGIMNIMFVSVNERTREIGLRKSLGAKKSSILTQFLIESVFLTSIGGALGIVLGVIIAWLISFGVNYFGYNWKFVITLMPIIISVLMAVSIGLIFGLWPAYRASKLNPIKALRYE